MLLAILWLNSLHAGCLAPALATADRDCAPRAADVVWRNPARERAAFPVDSLDPALRAQSFATGLRAAGTLEFDWKLREPHIVEVFIWEPRPPESSITLLHGTRPLDRRFERFEGPDRLSPRGGRLVALAGRVESGPIVVRSDSAGFVFAAIRWTPAAQFEKERIPALRKRLTQLYAKPYFGLGTSGATLRRNHIDQVSTLLRLSVDPVIQREGLLGQTRAAYWVAAENHRPRDIARTAELLRESLAAMPGEPIVRQMVSASCAATNSGRPMATGEFCQGARGVEWNPNVPETPPGAPAWAIAQRRLKHRMDAITRWWVEQRQQPNGELGGGWGDDVEILRHWGPLAMGLGSEVALRGVLRLADGLWNGDELKDGYSRHLSDVEHSSEPSTDTMPLRAAAAPEDPTGRERLRITAKCAANWIARQPDGHWRFPGSWFTCAEMDRAEPRAVDVHLNTRAMGPALWSAYFDRDPKLIALLGSWAESWLAAMRSTQHGKPAGLIPPVLRGRDGAYLIGSSRWDKPQAEWDYFQWSGSSQEAIASLFLALHDLTGDAKWSRAAGESFAALSNCAKLESYCAEMRKFPEALEEWRRRSGSASRRDGAAVKRGIEEMSRQLDARLATNFDMYTREVLWTDRVYYSLPAAYRESLFGGDAPRGDRYPMFAVSWTPIEGDFARAVLNWDSNGIDLAAYNFEAQPVTALLNAWRLKPGDYRCKVIDSTGKLRYEFLFSNTRLPRLVRIPLPSRTEVTVTIAAAKLGE